MSTTPVASKAAQREPGLRIPAHLGVIMDGTGRWAASRGKRRTEGHVAGVQALRRLVQLCIEYDVPTLTVFSFSSENWSRPPEEVSFIFSLLRRFVASDLERLVRNNVRVRVIGSRAGLEPSLVRLIDDAQDKTRACTGLNLNVAFNYGAKAELTEAARAIARAVQAGRMSPEDITEQTIASALYTAGTPDPDLIVRTSGEQRISNFQLWQAAYAEFVFIDEHWPDFDEAVFVRVLEQFSRRERRFGGLEARTR